MYVLMSPHTRGSVTVHKAFHTHFRLTLIIQFHLYSFAHLDFVLILFSEPPVTVIKKLEDLRFPEAAVASMDCELSRPHVEVKWMKVNNSYPFHPIITLFC